MRAVRAMRTAVSGHVHVVIGNIRRFVKGQHDEASFADEGAMAAVQAPAARELTGKHVGPIKTKLGNLKLPYAMSFDI